MCETFVLIPGDPHESMTREVPVKPAPDSPEPFGSADVPSKFGATGVVAVAPSIKSNTLWLSIGNLATAAGQAIVLVVLANALSQEAVGRYTLAIAVAGPVALFFEFRVREAIATDTSRRFLFSDYLRFGSVNAAVGVVVVALIAALAYGRTMEATIVVLVGSMKAVEAVGNIAYGIHQREERMRFVGLSMLAKAAIGALCLAVAVFAFEDLQSGLVALLAAWVVVVVAVDLPRARRLSSLVAETPTQPAQRSFSRLGATLFPLGLTSLAVALTATAPRIVLERSVGLAELGVFGAVAYSVVGLSPAVRAIAQGAAPRMARHIDAREMAEFRLVLGRSVALSLAAGLTGLAAALLVGRSALGLVFGDSYESGANTLSLLMIYATLLFASMPLLQAVVVVRRLYVQIPLFALVFGTAVVVSIPAIREFGMEGAALALIAAGLVRLLGLAFVVRDLIDPRQNPD